MSTLKYHPDARFLTDYAAASLPASQALCVATHLHYCAQCRQRVRDLTELGAELFMQQPAVAVDDAEFDRLLARLDHAPVAHAPVAAVPAPGGLPPVVHRMARMQLDRLPWRQVGRNFRYSPLRTGDRQRETSLLHIKAGGSVPQHRHQGDEITVILQGSFSDHEDKYGVGDFIVRTSGEVHRPVASQDEDCLCLSTLDAPIVMSNWLLRLGMKLLRPTA